jgi:hypothetical protein
MVRFVSLLSAAILISLPCVALADQTEDIIKWSQLPDMSVLGFDVSSEFYVPGTQSESRVADDFVCNDIRPITAVHWWGSYWQSPLGATPTSGYWNDPSIGPTAIVMPQNVLGFNIMIFDNVPVAIDPSTTPMPHAHPGQLLYSTFVPMAIVETNLHGVIDRTNDGIIGNVGDEAVWQYYVELEETFPQVFGTTYWLCIQAVVDGSPVQWGWHTAQPLTDNNAVQSGPATVWGMMYENQEWVLLVDRDMAFELSVGKIPEPFTAALLGLGLGGLMISRRRKAL